jgi:hypothetical protein
MSISDHHCGRHLGIRLSLKGQGGAGATPIAQMSEASCLTPIFDHRGLAGVASAALSGHDKPAHRIGEASSQRSARHAVEGGHRSNNGTAIGPPMLSP